MASAPGFISVHFKDRSFGELGGDETHFLYGNSFDTCVILTVKVTTEPNRMDIESLCEAVSAK